MAAPGTQAGLLQFSEIALATHFPLPIRREHQWLYFLEGSLELSGLVCNKLLCLQQSTWAQGTGLTQTWQLWSLPTLYQICFYRLLHITPACLQKRNYIMANCDVRSQMSIHFYTVIKVRLMYKWLLNDIKLQVSESHDLCISKVGLGHLPVLLYCRFLIKTVLITPSFNRIQWCCLLDN